MFLLFLSEKLQNARNNSFFNFGMKEYNDGVDDRQTNHNAVNNGHNYELSIQRYTYVAISDQNRNDDSLWEITNGDNDGVYEVILEELLSSMIVFGYFLNVFKEYCGSTD